MNPIISSVSQGLPPGLEDDSLEIYAKGTELKALYKGSRLDFGDLPEDIIEIFRKDMERVADRLELYKNIGISDNDEMLRHHVWCNYAGFNNEPDLNVSGELHAEYWDCGLRGVCKMDGKLCIKVNTEEHNPTKQELGIMKMIAEGLFDKEIADKLNISYNTVTTHRQHIEKKLRAGSKVDVATFAVRNNLPLSQYLKKQGA